MSETSISSPASIEATRQALSAKGIHSILVQFADIHGVAKGKLVPVGQLQQWVASGAGFAGPSIWGTGLPRMGARSEYYARLQLDSLRPLPFMPGVAHAVADGFAGAEPLDTCPRQVLKRQLQRIQQRGWQLWVGIEPEYFLLNKDAAGRWAVSDTLDTLSKPSYDLKALQRNRAYLEDMRQTLTDLGFVLEQIDHEDATGQYEINYRFDEALGAADRFMLFKLAAHAVAANHGMTFSCMPKPLAHAPGSGLHFHLSITDRDGRPIFSDRDDTLGLSAQGYQFVAGLLAHADALSALCAPTVNSYKRLASSASASGTTWSPVWKAFGENNRSCLVRTVAGRLEWRLPDPSCNVYAAIAATLAAGLDGIDRGLTAPSPCEVDLYQLVQDPGAAMPEALPRDLYSALAALQSDAVLREAVGEAFCAQFVQIKKAEWDAFHQHVSEWELGRYSDGF